MISTPVGAEPCTMDDRKQFAADVLEYATYHLLEDRAFKPGRQVAELTVLGLYFKTLAGLESVITLAEKGLPTFAIIREMLETLISLTYIVASDPLVRAELYRDYLHIMRWKSLADRARTPGLEETASASQIKQLEVEKVLVEKRRGSKVVEEMQNFRKWKTWAGNKTVRQMAREVGMSETTYSLGYAWPSQAVHAQDADRYFSISDDGIVRPARPSQPESALLPAASIVLVGMEAINGFLNLGKTETLRKIKGRIDALARAALRE